MSIIKKNIYLISCFVVTAIVAIFNLLSSSYTSSTINELMEDVHGSEAYYTNWNVAVIVLMSVLILTATVCMLFNTYQVNSKPNKITQLILFITNIVVTVLTIFFICFVVFRRCKYDYMLSIEQEVKTMDANNYVCDTMYTKCFAINMIACISNLVMSALSCASYNSDTALDKEELDEDENSIVKGEIQKLKKQLELEDLKTEYAKLYKKLNNEKAPSQNEKSEDEQNSNAKSK